MNRDYFEVVRSLISPRGRSGKRLTSPLQLETLEVRVVPSAATINWTDVHQQIAGFGASSAWTLPSMTTAQANLFFSQTNGIGLSLLRSQISDTSTSGTSNEIATMKQAQALGATVWSTPWSPPAQWKSNGSVDNGGSLLPSHYQDYANLLTNYVLNMKAQGINIYAVSIQNEPDISISYDSATWTAQQLHDFVAILGPTFAQNGVAAKIMLPEQSGWSFDLASTTLSDPNTAKYVGIVAAHDYDGGVGPGPQTGSMQLWETEVSDFNSFDPSMTSGLMYATEIYNFMTVAQANAWNFWWLQSANSDNEGLLGTSGQVTKRLYTLGNYSKFIRPGYDRIGETDDGGVLISAYKNISTGQFVFVAVNSGAATTETFNLNGFSTSTVTPWVTSASLNLAQQAAVTVNGSTFTFTLAAGSVTTFVGTAGNVSPPSAPTGVTATPSNQQVSLSWNGVSGAASYNIYRSTSSGGEGSTPYLTGLTSTSITDAGLTNGTTYYYQVSAVNSGGESGKSTEVSATPQVTAPPTPTGLTATAGNAQVALTWTATSGAASYDIYRSTSSGGEGSTPYKTGMTAASFTDTNLTNGTTYYYQVSAVNATGQSGKSSEVSATPQAAGNLVLAIDAGGGAAGSFVADTDFSGGVHFSSTDTINTSHVSNPAPQSVYDTARYDNSTYTIPGLTAGAVYTVRLDFAETYWSSAGSRLFNVAINGTQVLTNFDIVATAGGKDIAIAELLTATADSSGKITIQFTSVKDTAWVSGIEILTAGTSGAPAAPTGLTASAGNTQATLAWSACSGASTYNIYRSTSSGGEGSTPFKTGMTSTSFTDSGLSNGTKYYYQVSAVNSGGQSGKSTEVSAMPQVSAPVAPTGVTVTGGNAQVSLTWTASSGAASYNIYRSTASGGEGGVPVKTGVTTASFTDTSLTNGTKYFYQVSAVNAGGESGKSTEVSATPQVSAPSAPTGLVATAGNAQVSLTWTASSGATSYNIYRSTASGSEGSTPFKTGVTITSFTDTALINGTTFYYQVTAVNAGGQSGKSSEVSATPLASAPVAPTGLTATAGDAQVALIWTASSGATSYSIYRSTFRGGEGSTPIKTGATSTSFTDTGLSNGTMYYYQVTAVNSGGESGRSSEASAMPQVAPPMAPTALTATAGNGQVTLTWTPSAGATLYNIYRSTTSGGESITPYSVTGTSFTDTGLTNGTTYYYQVTAVNTAGVESARSSEVSATPQSTGSLVLAIDSGGAAAGSFVADTDFSGGIHFSSTDTINTSHVSNPAPQSVYDSARYGDFTYTIPGLTGGAVYTVRLDFAETYWSSAGSRLFNVNINGTQVLTNFDIFATAGGKDIAIAEQFTATADNSGKITIQFTSVKDTAWVSGIEILTA